MIKCSLAISTGLANLAVASGAAGQGSPDLLISQISSIVKIGPSGGEFAYAVGTVTCNLGNADLEWEASGPRHPVFAMNLYRIVDGRLEQIGQSWARHQVIPLAQNHCNIGCNGHFGSVLGAGCSDPRAATSQADQSSMGWRLDVMPVTGELMVYPFSSQASGTGAMLKRCRVQGADLVAGAAYIVEATYMSAADTRAGAWANNYSARTVQIDAATGNAALTGVTAAGQTAVQVWAMGTTGAQVRTVDLPGDGRVLVGSAVIPVAGGYRYDYVIQNLTSASGVAGLAVPKRGAAVDAMLYHGSTAHSGEPVDTQGWMITDDEVEIGWSSQDPPAGLARNAVRWGTAATCSFVSPEPPELGVVRVVTGGGSHETEAYVPVVGALACPCNWNRLGGIDSQDYFAFIEGFFGGQGDVNGDAETDSQDFFEFLNCFFGDTCRAH